jgi:hypothetical protein
MPLLGTSPNHKEKAPPVKPGEPLHVRKDRKFRLGFG